MSDSDKGQVSSSAAEVYEEFFVPALFREWAGPVGDAARVQKGDRVLDVACGTGVLARTLVERVGPTGEVVGLDINEGMLAIAEQQAADVTWRHGQAEALPFDNAQFDAVVSQFGLMFFEDRPAAINEMVRVLKPGGRLAVAVWDTLTNTPGYAAMVDLLQRLFDDSVANGLRAPYILGDVKQLHALFSDVGLSDTVITTREGSARFPSIESWVYTDIKGWTLADALDDDQFELLLTEAKQTLKPFVTSNGSVSFSAPAHIVSAVRL